MADSEPEQTSKKKADPLIYIIIFAVLFFVALGLLTWVLDVYNKHHQCVLNPKFWCSDNWACQNICTSTTNGCQDNNGNTVNAAYCDPSLGTTGLASSLYGPRAEGAQNCLNPGLGDSGVGACTCPTGIDTSQLNCFNGCAVGLTALAEQYQNNPTSITCCCQSKNFEQGTALYNFCAAQENLPQCKIQNP